MGNSTHPVDDQQILKMELIMKITRRNFIQTSSAFALAAPAIVSAQTWPSKPIRIVVPAPAGSAPDSDMRQVASRLQSLLGQPVVLDNRPGAGTRIAAEHVAKSAPDGYTFLFATPSIATMSVLFEKLTFDPRQDLMPVSMLFSTPYALTVNSNVPVKTMSEYIARLKADRDYNKTATLGLGTLPHLAGAAFGSATGTQLEFIHYATQPPYTDLLAGRTQCMFETLLPMSQHVRAGTLRLLAFAGNERSSLFPDVPTFAEAGLPNYNPAAWVGIMAPSGTPRAIIERMSTALTQVARMPEMIQQRRELGGSSRGGTPEEFGQHIDSQTAIWGQVVRQHQIKLG